MLDKRRVKYLFKVTDRIAAYDHMQFLSLHDVNDPDLRNLINVRKYDARNSGLDVYYFDKGNMPLTFDQALELAAIQNESIADSSSNP